MTTVTETKQEDLAFKLAEYVVKTGYDDLPRDVVELTKESIIDTLGVIIAASTTVPGCKELVDLVAEAGGKKESTILGFGIKVPAWMAAFANGAMGHGLDYDDIYHEANLHPGAPTIPAALAIAERVGGISGKQFIAAVAVGEDIICRFGLGVKKSSHGWRLDWHLTPTLGCFSAAAAAGKLLGLDEGKMVDAFGIAFNRAAGTMELAYGVGSNLRAMYPAFPGIAGTLSALMAQRGITGVKSFLEGKAGLFNVYFGGDFNRECLSEGLGKRFENADLSFKAWPACGGNHCYIDATLQLVKQDDIKPQDVAEFKMFVGDFTKLMCEPIEVRRKPTFMLDAKFSLPFNIAVAVAHRAVRIGDFLGDALNDPVVLGLTQKIVPVYSNEFDAGKLAAPMPAVIEIRTNDGKVHTKRVDIPYGDHHNPMSTKDIIAKFRDCVSYSVKPISARKLDSAVNMMLKLEEVDDVAKVVKLLA